VVYSVVTDLEHKKMLQMMDFSVTLFSVESLGWPDIIPVNSYIL